MDIIWVGKSKSNFSAQDPWAALLLYLRFLSVKKQVRRTYDTDMAANPVSNIAHFGIKIRSKLYVRR